MACFVFVLVHVLEWGALEFLGGTGVVLVVGSGVGWGVWWWVFWCGCVGELVGILVQVS